MKKRMHINNNIFFLVQFSKQLFPKFTCKMFFYQKVQQSMRNCVIKSQKKIKYSIALGKIRKEKNMI